MRVLVLGGTGSIGAPVVRELVKRAHEVLVLARSSVAAQKVADLGAQSIDGDIRTPGRWIGALPALDALIHAASDFGSTVGAIDRRLLDVLLPHLAAQPRMAKFLYTGGCWLFGATGDRVATEATPLAPLAGDAWALPQLRRLFDAPGIASVVIHPAMVYEPNGGVFGSFARDAIGARAIRIIGGEHVRWPLVHSQDLAVLYALALEGAAAGESYIGSTIDGLAEGRIAQAFARRFGTLDRKPVIVSADEIAAELGEYARGYALDQQLSGEKARRRLGWQPQHLDPESEIAAIA